MNVTMVKKTEKSPKSININPGQIAIVIDPAETMELTESKKSFRVFSSGGNQPTGLTADNGMPIVAGVNLFCKNPDYVKPPKA